jgi:hypothetical protein
MVGGGQLHDVAQAAIALGQRCAWRRRRPAALVCADVHREPDD